MDEAFWNSVRAKSEEILESTKIFLANRIERDAKLIASVGIFAWQRAVRDVGRALVSARNILKFDALFFSCLNICSLPLLH